MVILGIDPGTNCGWAVRYSDGSCASGVWRLANKKGEHVGQRFRKLVDVLRRSIEAVRPSVICYEQVRRHNGVTAAHIYGGIIAVIQAVAAEYNVPIETAHVGEIKRTATGCGDAAKETMITSAMMQWPGFQPQDDNEADARWVVETVWRRLQRL